MRELKQLDGAGLERAYNEVFREAFPPAELKPLWSIREMIASGEYSVLAMREGAAELGYICLWTDLPYVLIDYLCVPREKRGRGTGGEIIAETVAAFPEDTVFIGEVEAPTGEPERDGIILRRLDFYRRCGAVTLSYDTALFGVHYKTIVWSKAAADEAEVLRRHSGFYRRRFPEGLYAAAVRIPLAAGESADVTGLWEKWNEGEGGGKC